MNSNAPFWHSIRDWTKLGFQLCNAESFTKVGMDLLKLVDLLVTLNTDPLGIKLLPILMLHLNNLKDIMVNMTL